ncbi:hypothetical protein GCM10010430_75910 [Kitasatospora cystarginea]|uniref:Uncharacterized protein n=1 Tax=Kitasatospora cystarginea TaxID=58350 RepID=A0ABN3F057_9ACTN
MVADLWMAAVGNPATTEMLATVPVGAARIEDLIQRGPARADLTPARRREPTRVPVQRAVGRSTAKGRAGAARPFDRCSAFPGRRTTAPGKPAISQCPHRTGGRGQVTYRPARLRSQRASHPGGLQRRPVGSVG